MEILFKIRSPKRLTAKNFANVKKHSVTDYDVDEDDQRQCLMAFILKATSRRSSCTQWVFLMLLSRIQIILSNGGANTMVPNL